MRKLVAGFTALALVITIVIAWFVNFNKFTECDFESPYKCEAIHAAGLIPLFSLVTVWSDVEDDE